MANSRPTSPRTVARDLCPATVCTVAHRSPRSQRSRSKLVHASPAYSAAQSHARSITSPCACLFDVFGPPSPSVPSATCCRRNIFRRGFAVYANRGPTEACKEVRGLVESTNRRRRRFFLFHASESVPGVRSRLFDDFETCFSSC